MPDALASYPVDSDLVALFDSCQIVDTGGVAFGKINLAAKLGAAITWWEKATGWRPYLVPVDQGTGDPVITTRLFDIPHASRILELRAGLLSVTSLTIFDLPYDQDTDFFLEPANAASEVEPYTHIRFLGRLHSRLPNAIAITGVWGNCASCPFDAWEAILENAALRCVPELALGISKGLYERRAGDELERFAGSGQSPLSAEAALWKDYSETTAHSKKRITA